MRQDLEDVVDIEHGSSSHPEGSGTGVLSVMLISNWFVSKRLEDYTVRLVPEGGPLPRAGDERKMPGQKSGTSQAETQRKHFSRTRVERAAALLRIP